MSSTVTARPVRPRIEQPAQTGVNVASFRLIGVAPYSQSAMLPEKPKKEDHDTFDARIWREHCHTNDHGQIVLPAMALKKAVQTAATMLKERIPGKGQATWTKLIVSGLLVLEDMPIVDEDGAPVMKGTVDMWGGWMNSGGKAGVGARVLRRFPMIPAGWETTASVTCVNPALPAEVVRQHIEEAGRFVGVGRWRAEVGGLHGRFIIRDWTWSVLTA